MIKPSIPKNEKDRLKELESYSILDTLPEKEYDEITYLASQICGTPISLISLLDDARQWFKSHHGLDATETPKELAFCAHAINDKHNAFIINDAREDDRFFDNPLVTAAPDVIFYAGIPLLTPKGFPIGTLCVIDNKPKDLNEGQIEALRILSNQLMKLLELRKNKKELELKNKKLNDSIDYAQKIQFSILPTKKEIQKIIPSVVIYNKPKDIIGGDFYWFHQGENMCLIGTIDCTGHGVPGALMSMTIYSLLNGITVAEGITEPHEILSRLHAKLYLTLKQEKGDSYSQDGCDLTICKIDFDKKEVIYAGAQNDLYTYDGTSLTSHKTTRKSIGGLSMLGKSDPTRVFEQNTIPFQDELLFILTTDGIIDQLNDNDKPFVNNEFEKMISSVYNSEDETATKMIEASLNQWMSGTVQVDDQLVIGFTLNSI